MPQIIDRSRPPEPGKPSQRSFPSFVRHSLSNGIPVYVVENHMQPFVSLQMVFRSGASSDGNLPGLAEFTSNLLLSGAGEWNAQELAEEIDFLGATLDASAGRDETTVSLGVLTTFLAEGLDLMANMVLRPSFPADELQRERKQSLAALKQHRSDPNYLAAVQFRREIYSTTPYGTELDGTEESLKRITRADCVRYHRTHFTAGNAFFVAAGDVHRDEFIAMLEARFGQMTGSQPERPSITEFEREATPRVVIVDRPGSLQSAFRVGAPAIARSDPDYIALATLNTLFGGYFNSRINQNLRERNGYTYGARSLIDALLMPGTISIAASVGTDVTEAALGEIFNELQGIVTDRVPEEELDLVRNYIVGSQALQIETPGQVASFVRTIALHNLPADYFERFPAVVRSITGEDLLAVARRYYDPSRMVAVVTGDASVIAPKLERFGPVRIVDEKGSRVERSEKG